MDNILMSKIKLEALDRIDGIAWEENLDAEQILQRIQAVLYEMSQMQDAQSDRMFGDDDAHIDSPNMRRC